MKKIQNVLFLISLIFISACGDDFLNVELKNDLGVDSFYDTPEDALAAITSCYDPIKQRGVFGQNYQYIFYALDDRTINENSALNEFSFTASEGYFGGDRFNFSLWDHFYRGVFRCNLALKHIPSIEIQGEDPVGYPVKERYLGEAHFMRALYYFYLTVHFNEPVLLEEPAFDLSFPYTNADHDSLWNFIERDLQYAIDHLPAKSEYSDKDLGRATKGAAQSLLGKSYIYQQKWSEAISVFEQVIASGEYALSLPAGNEPLDYVYAYLSNFSFMDLPGPEGRVYKSEHNIESIFEINNSDNTENIINEWNPGMQSDGTDFTAWFGAQGFKNIVPKAEMAEQYERTPAGHPMEIDPRYKASIFEVGDTVEIFNPGHPDYMKPFDPLIHTNGGITEGYGLKKYLYPGHYSSSYGAFLDPTNWRLIRYADVLLMFAEACYHVNDPRGIGALNEVRQRAGLDDVDVLTPEAIMHERDVELYGECVRFPDMVRWLTLPEPWVKASDIHTNFTEGKHEFLPIPEVDIIRLGQSLEQNPGW